MDEDEKKVLMEAITDTVDDLWGEFDSDNSGFLEREEFKVNTISLKKLCVQLT